MSRRLLGVNVLALSMLAIAAAPGMAAFDLRITEVWVGQDGSDLSEDWFELKNFGDTAWTSALGAMSVNDNGGGITSDVPVSGITEIQPGGVAVVLMEGVATSPQAFFDLWNPVKPQILANIGYADGSGLGLGAGGDSVNLYINEILEDSFTYNSSTSGVSIDVILGQESSIGNASGAVATLLVNDAGEPAVGSPGMVVPEPGCALVVLGLVSLAMIGRRR
jgi:hypothetical protein